MTWLDAKKIVETYSEICDDETETVEAGDWSVVKYLGADGFGGHYFRCKDKKTDYENGLYFDPVSGSYLKATPFEVQVTKDGKVLIPPL